MAAFDKAFAEVSATYPWNIIF